MSYVIGRGPEETAVGVGPEGADPPSTLFGLRGVLRAEGVLSIIADVVETECGAAPLRAHRNSVSWKAYRAAVQFLAESLDAWRRVARPDEPSPDLRAFAFVAANRACWAVLQGNDAERARLRSQIRCIFALTPGYALWRTPPGAIRRRSEWLVGRGEWRDAGRPAMPLSPEAMAEWAVPGWANGSTFDAVRAAVLDIANRNGSPVAVEALVTALGREPGDGDVAADQPGSLAGRPPPRRAIDGVSTSFSRLRRRLSRR